MFNLVPWRYFSSFKEANEVYKRLPPRAKAKIYPCGKGEDWRGTHQLFVDRFYFMELKETGSK